MLQGDTQELWVKRVSSPGGHFVLFVTGHRSAINGTRMRAASVLQLEISCEYLFNGRLITAVIHSTGYLFLNEILGP